jgi:hypothetical protein
MMSSSSSREVGSIQCASSKTINVQVFQHEGEGWSTRCTVPISQAHRVAFHGRYVYATSLTDRQIVKIDPDRCIELARVGGAGWNPGQFLWPTSVAPWDDKSVVVTDAHTGMITIIDADSLSVGRRFGGNGPGITGLNMSYGIFVEAKDALVTDSFGSRVVAFDKTSGEMTEIWSAKPLWQTAPTDLRRASLDAEHRDYYTRKDVSVTIGGQCYHPDYARLAACDDPMRGLTIHRVGGIFLYMIEAMRAEHGVLVFSPSAPWALYYNDKDLEHPSQLRIGWDHWLVDGRVVGPDGVLDLAKLLRLHTRVRTDAGWPRR